MNPTYGNRHNLKHELANTKTHKHTVGMDITPVVPTKGQKFQWHIQEHLEFFAVFQNVHIFIPRFFTKALTILCGTLDDKTQSMDEAQKTCFWMQIRW